MGGDCELDKLFAPIGVVLNENPLVGWAKNYNLIAVVVGERAGCEADIGPAIVGALGGLLAPVECVNGP